MIPHTACLACFEADMEAMRAKANELILTLRRCDPVVVLVPRATTGQVPTGVRLEVRLFS